MAKTDLHPAAADSPAVSSTDTDELAWELQQKKPDTHRIQWLLEDMGADLTEATKKAGLKTQDLLKNPLLRPYLQKHLH